MLSKRKIALIGMMASGKTTISKKLADILNIEALDCDDIFERKENIKIKDYFKKFGEKDFRKKESEILLNISKKDSFILSTGGGIILDEKNRTVLFESDITTFYLYADKNEILKRIKNDSSRPLLNVENKEKEIEKIILNRKKYYEMADFIIDTNNKPIENITKEIIEKLK